LRKWFKTKLPCMKLYVPIALVQTNHARDNLIAFTCYIHKMITSRTGNRYIRTRKTRFDEGRV
jgi:hypothetical protein